MAVENSWTIRTQSTRKNVKDATENKPDRSQERHDVDVSRIGGNASDSFKAAFVRAMLQHV